MRLLQLMSLLFVAPLGAVPIPGVEARPQIYDLRGSYVKTGSHIASEYVNIKPAIDEVAVKRSPRLKFNPTPIGAVAVVPSTTPQTHADRATFHRIDITEEEYLQRGSMRWGRRRTQKYDINHSGRKASSRREAEILPVAALPIKSRRGMRKMAHADLKE